MNKMSKIAIALTAAASCSFALADMSSDADQARRQQNVDEVMARHHLDHDGNSTTQSMATPEHQSVRQRTHRIAEKTRSKTHDVAEKTRETTHEAADSTRNFTHRQLQKSRAFGARQDAKYKAKTGHAPTTQESQS